MQLPRSLLFTCCTFCIVHHGSSFQLPRFDDISETFGSLLRKVRSTSGEEVKLEEDKAQSRSKRQTTNIGDESPHPYEIRSSRLQAVIWYTKIINSELCGYVTNDFWISDMIAVCCCCTMYKDRHRCRENVWTQAGLYARLFNSQIMMIICNL